MMCDNVRIVESLQWTRGFQEEALPVFASIYSCHSLLQSKKHCHSFRLLLPSFTRHVNVVYLYEHVAEGEKGKFTI